MEEYQKEARRNVKSGEELKLMFQRNNETEGHLETGKANQKYDRLYRRGENGVKLEIYLVAIGHNIRKYHSQKKIK